MTSSVPSSKSLIKSSVLKDATLYYFNHPSSTEMRTFNDALNTTLWRNYLKPFACAVIHNDSKDVILVRDHIGLEPLYYCHYLGKNLIFAQSIPEILEQLPNHPPLLESQIDMLFSENKIYSDETHYQGIYRVEPGHLMHFKSDGTVVKKAFWQLDPHQPMLDYKNEQDYHDHFSMLMTESLRHATDNQSNIAAEFSAGLDSSAIYCAAANLNIEPKLYMHIANPGSKSANTYNDYYEKAFIDHYQLNDIQRIGSNNFNPIDIFKDYAALFAGPAPYLFHMFANPLHQAVAAGQHHILLSGFGGDQCLSGQLPLNFFLPELLHQGEYRQAWQSLPGTNKIKQSLLLAKHMHPTLYAIALNLKKNKRQLKNVFLSQATRQSTLIHPYERMYYPTVREAECALLQGPESHEVRMRIEYSSIISKKMGFEYRYPLLYPKLLEFMLRVPTVQKRRDGKGRYLIRHYLSQNLPQDIFSSYRKQDGLGIVPSTFDLFQNQFEQGCYQHDFVDLPYGDKVKHKEQPIELRNHIKAYMLKSGIEP